MQGFYDGQFTNYMLFAGITLLGFLIKKINLVNVLAASVIAPSIYFLVSNFFVWINGAGFNRPKTWDGLMACYTDALPFYRTELAATIFFSAVLKPSPLLSIRIRISQNTTFTSV